MCKLSDTLTRTQVLQLTRGELTIHVTDTGYPGCYIVQDDQGRTSGGLSPRQAIESLEHGPRPTIRI